MKDIFTKTFAKTTNGEIHVVYSDNADEETMNLIPEKQWDNDNGTYDAEWICAKEYPYSEIVVTDTNLAIVKYTHV